MRGALLIAKEEYPDLDVEAYLDRIAEMAREAVASRAVESLRTSLVGRAPIIVGRVCSNEKLVGPFSLTTAR